MPSSIPPLTLLSAAEQVAAHLRTELLQGRWSETIPGEKQLATELGVNRKTTEAALRQLEREGLLVSQGPRRKRLIVMPDHGAVVRPMTVGILIYGRDSNKQVDYLDSILYHALVNAGHQVIFPAKSQEELKFDVKRIARLVKKTEVDAWVINGGSRKLLEWFSTQPEPSFALFGRREKLPLAAIGPDKALAQTAATRELIRLGHERISLLVRAMRRLPEPGRSERRFLNELEAHGLPIGDFNLPDWEDTSAGFQKLLGSLFQVTPPTALIIDQAFLFVAAQQFLAKHQIQVPRDVSLICTDDDPTFEWCTPSIAHLRWDPRSVVRRIVRWAETVGKGQSDIRQTLVPAEFVNGGTVGEVKKS